ncbi:MAG: hypothetical protein EU542_08650 [Promethearchaeota archaeon]|nr:MAG: hypothetical protein EU542_08650 [Candidatus Lokiarchaeota archaeon]
MRNFRKLFETNIHVNVSHDLQRQILEILSLARVINNYYYKKGQIQDKIKPLLVKKFREELEIIEKNRDWLFGIPSVLDKISQDFISRNDSFRFPDSIILFEAWMSLGMRSLYPQVALHFKFPGFLKGEKTRHIFQYIFSTSRGLAFPIYFPPEYYDYNPSFLKYLNPFFKWVYKICHYLNKIIFKIEKIFNSKRHHPGEFESVIISKYNDNVYKGINTLFHGYFTDEPKILSQFASLGEVLKNVIFCYRIGDHAVEVKINRNFPTMEVPLISNNLIKKRYEVDFYSYIKQLMTVNNLLTKKIEYYRNKRKKLIKSLSMIDQLKFWLHISKKLSLPGQHLPPKYAEIEKYHKHKHLIEKLRTLLWITPLFTHTIHSASRVRESFKFSRNIEQLSEYENDLESSKSIFFTFISLFEKEEEFEFLDEEVVVALEDLRDMMAKMWLYFKERHLKYALRSLNDIARLPIKSENYKTKIEEKIKKLIPIIAIYEIFNRPLSESVYPEAIPQTKRFGAYLAKFLTSRYNIIGLNLIKFFNRLAYRNWAHLIKQKKLSFQEFFKFVFNLEIWKYIPDNIKQIILDDSL